VEVIKQLRQDLAKNREKYRAFREIVSPNHDDRIRIAVTFREIIAQLEEEEYMS
jgi:hypothetical protein